MEIKLSKRLMKVAQYIPKGSRLADIGSDHALLPVYAMKQGFVRQAIAGEVNQGPLQAAIRQISAYGLQAQISARLGDGLEIIEPGEVDVITIAGMGGNTITSILEKGLSKLAGVKKLILQPNVGESKVRQWLHDHQWLLTDEVMLEEDGLYYEILTAVPVATKEQQAEYDRLYAAIPTLAADGNSKALLWLMGPYFLRRPDSVFYAKWDEEIGKRERILRRMNQAQTAEAAAKRKELLQETEMMKEAISCLRMGKPLFN